VVHDAGFVERLFCPDSLELATMFARTEKRNQGTFTIATMVVNVSHSLDLMVAFFWLQPFLFGCFVRCVTGVYELLVFSNICDKSS
jgi:hypothetical protein